MDDMDLLDKLKEQSEWYSDGHGPLHAEAAAEIARLRAVVQDAHDWFDLIRPKQGPGTLPTWFVNAREALGK